MNQSITSISPASPTEAKSALVALFAAFPVDRGEGSAAVATYLIAIEGYSLKAVQMAVKRLIRGEIAGVDPRFLPTPAQVSAAVRYCENLIAPVVPRKALPAPGDVIPGKESRERVKEMAKRWPNTAVPSPYDEYDAWVSAKASIPAKAS